MKAQVSAEFLLLFIVVIIIFVFFIGISIQFESLARHNVKMDSANAIAFSIAHLANAVLVAGDGITVNITIPAGYNVSYRPYSIVVTDEDGNEGSSPILTNRTDIAVTNQTLEIKNLNGEVLIIG